MDTDTVDTDSVETPDRTEGGKTDEAGSSDLPCQTVRRASDITRRKKADALNRILREALTRIVQIDSSRIVLKAYAGTDVTDIAYKGIIAVAKAALKDVNDCGPE